MPAAGVASDCSSQASYFRDERHDGNFPAPFGPEADDPLIERGLHGTGRIGGSDAGQPAEPKRDLIEGVLRKASRDAQRIHGARVIDVRRNSERQADRPERFDAADHDVPAGIIAMIRVETKLATIDEVAQPRKASGFACHENVVAIFRLAEDFIFVHQFRRAGQCRSFARRLQFGPNAKQASRVQS